MGKAIRESSSGAQMEESTNLGMCVLTQRECKPNNSLVDEYRKGFESLIFAGAIEKLPDSGKGNGKVTVWSYDMAGTRTKMWRKELRICKQQHRAVV